MDGVEKAAVLLLGIGEGAAAEVLKHMGHREVQKLGLAMASVEQLSKENVNTVFEDFISEAKELTNIGIGTEDYLRKTLVAALGDEKASNIIERIFMGNYTKSLETLKWMDARSIADVIRNEHPQIIAVILTYLDGDQAAEVLSYFPEERMIDFLLRISSLESVQPAALQELNAMMEKHMAKTSAGKSKMMGGTKAVAEILNFVEKKYEEPIMVGLKENSEGLVEEIQELMFVFDNLIEIDDRGMQTLLREVSSESLLLALKGCDESMKVKFFSNMSKRAAELLQDDLEAKGPVKLSEVESAQKEIVAVARKLADSGEILLASKGEEMV